MSRSGLDPDLAGLPAAITGDPHPGLVRWVLHALYDCTWLVAALFGLPWLLWRSRTRPGFGGMVLDRLGRGAGQIPVRGERQRVVVHGVSVGEIKGALPVVRELERVRPDLEVVISASTETGRKVARSIFPKHLVVDFPVDLSFVVRRFFQRVDPCAVILIELEIWPNFLRLANRRGIPVAVVNGRITAKSFRSYRRFKGFLPQFNRISLFCSQASEYTKRFLQLQVDPLRVVETGNVKADGLAIGTVDPGEELVRLLGARSGQRTLVAGSTHGDEELQVARAMARALPNWRLILVPRHPQRAAEVVASLMAAGISAQRLTDLRRGAVPDPKRVAVVDTIGELEAVFGLADLAMVGGSLVERGGQNMLEPSAQGIPVITGPYLANFQQEAKILQEAGALVVLERPDELASCLERLGADGELREAMGRAGMAATTAQQGAAQKTVAVLQIMCLGAE